MGFGLKVLGVRLPAQHKHNLMDLSRITNFER